MRILMINKNWFEHGGLERHMFDVKRVFEELGHEVVAFAMADPKSEPISTDVHFVSPVSFRGGGVASRLRSTERAVFGVETVKKLGELLDAEQIDAAHVLHGYHQLGPAFMRLLRRRGIPTVLSVHDYKLGCPSYRLFDDSTEQICTRCFDQRFSFLWAPAATGCWDGSRTGGLILGLEATATRALGAVSRAPSAVMTVNRLQADGARRMGVPDERLHVVPHFATIDPATPPRFTDASSVGPHVLYVGRLVPEKGVDTLIRAAAHGGFAVHIVGDGRSEGDLRDLADQLGADVTFVGRLDADEVTAAMASAAAVVVPSVWHEVWGLVINEAFDAGAPVIGSDVGGITDLLSGNRGYLVPPGDVEALASTVDQVLSDPDAATERARTARHWAATELTRAQFVDNLRNVWKSAGVEL